jgi:hypothetical protein
LHNASFPRSTVARSCQQILIPCPSPIGFGQCQIGMKLEVGIVFKTLKVPTPE